MNDKQQQLARQWGAVTESAGQAIDWVETVRRDSKRLNSEADSLVHHLRRARNKSRDLKRAAETRMTIGFFGMSQAGKSVLISALGAGQNGRFEAQYGARQVDFISHINPSGMGKESTGLVTRFTRQGAKVEDAAFPVEVRLFREIDLAKILSNAWFNDFDQNRVEYRLDESRIEPLLRRFEDRAGAALQPGVDADDVVSLWDYVHQSFERQVKPLENGYWREAMQLAPRLTPTERAELFSVLWGEIPELTRAYADIATSLRALGNAEMAFLPLDALAQETGGQLEYSRDSIMSVDVLLQLGAGAGKTLSVRPVIDGALAAPVPVRIPHLGTLTRELVFPLMNTPREASVEQVDLLDFPGYRGRYKEASLADIPAEGDPVGQLLLRGKVAYLFENYTDTQAMNGLVMCVPEQVEVPEIVPVVERWVQRTQGDAPDVRAQHACGLFWAVTKFDIRLDRMLGIQSDTQIAEGWTNMIRGSLEERFGSLGFMNDWAGGTPFNNGFIVRNPAMGNSFMAKEDGREKLQEEKIPKLQTLRASFVADKMVQRRVRNPEAAWDAVLTPDNGGMSMLAQAIDEIANIDFKLSRLQQQLDEELRAEKGIVARLSRYYQVMDGDDVKKKEQIGLALTSALFGLRKGVPELQHALELSSEDLRDLYLGGLFKNDAPQEQETAEETAAQPAGGFNPFASFASSEANPFAQPAAVADAAPVVAATASPKPVFQTADHRFAAAVFQKWVAHLRDFPDRKRLLDALGLKRETAELLVDELITAANRLELPEQLEAAALSHQDSGSKREQVAMRQVLRVQTVLRDFIAWLGYLGMEQSQRPLSLVNGQPLFTKTTRLEEQEPRLPVLDDKPLDTNAEYVGYWLTGLKDLVLNNAGHTAGSDISLEQNLALGGIIKHFEQA